jgi:23S rRNA pseudouridine2457 synthase
MHQYFLVNKPYNMLSQFVSSYELPVLGDLDFIFPEGTHAIGRLDKPSEGLLLLTTNSKVTKLLFESKIPHPRTYLVMVKGIVSEENVERLRNGISILLKDNKGWYTTKPCIAEITTTPLQYYAYATDEREKYPHTWLVLTLTEGKFRQIRKMVTAIKHPCMRLIRITIHHLTVQDIAPGQVKPISETEFKLSLDIQ